MEYDIANAIGLEKALHNSKSVKMLFLVKESTITEERGSLFRKLIIELTGFAKGTEIENFLPTVAVFITHCSLYVDKGNRTRRLRILVNKLKEIAEETKFEDKDEENAVKTFIKAAANNLVKKNNDKCLLGYVTLCPAKKMINGNVA